MTKPGRNDPCPCGSGKKYKQCCWGQSLPKKKIHAVRVIPGSIRVPSPFGKIMAPPSQEADDEVQNEVLPQEKNEESDQNT